MIPKRSKKKIKAALEKACHNCDRPVRCIGQCKILVDELMKADLNIERTWLCPVCGRPGRVSMSTSEDGKIQCTGCANKMRGM